MLVRRRSPGRRSGARLVRPGSSVSTASGAAHSGGPNGGGSGSARGGRTGSVSAAAVQRERHRLRRRPGPRPVRGRDRDAQPVAGRDRLGDRVEADAHVVAARRARAARASAWPSRWVRFSSPRVMSSDDAVGRDRAQAHGDERVGPVDCERQRDLGEPEQLDAAPRGRLRSKHERALVLGPLVAAASRPAPPSGHQAPASAPVDSDAAVRDRHARSGSEQACDSTDGGGQAGSVTQRPGRCS